MLVRKCISGEKSDYRAGAYGAAGTAMAVPLFWSRCTILRVKIEKMEWVGLRHANFSLARGRTYGTAAVFLFCSEMAECSKVTEARVTAETGVMDVPDQPYQPTDCKFPVRSFGNTKPVRRTFQASWFQKFKWLHYDAAKDAAFCFSCCRTVKSGKLKLKGTTENAVLISGFTNWKDATRAMNKHGNCNIDMPMKF